MTRIAPTPALRLASGAAALAALLFAGPYPAAADSFSLGYGAGHGRRHHHHGHWHHRNHYRGPIVRYGYAYSPPVYYAPPPSVIYVPTPPVVSAIPASPVYRAPNGQYCREYQSTVIVGGAPQPSYGTACQQPDGSWRVVD